MSSEGAGKVIAEVCREFSRNEIEPVALELDEGHRPERVKAVWRKSLDLDLPSLLIPEEHGGVGHDALTAAQVLEEMARACTGIATLFACHLAASLALAQGGGERAAFLAQPGGEGDGEAPMLTVAFPAAFEADDLPQLESQEGELALSGRATLVPCAPLADYLVIFVPEANGATAVLADLREEGVEASEPRPLLGLHALPFCDLTFSACRLGTGDILGEGEAGAALLDRTLGVFHGFLAAVAVGTARRARDAALRYARERYQFGKLIVEHHEIRRMLSNMDTKIEMGTAGYRRALSQHRSPGGANGDLARAKVFCTDAALEIVLDAIQIHGGYGYMKETGLEKMMRDAKMLQLMGGSNRRLEVG